MAVKVLKFLLVAGVAALIGYFFKSGGLRVLKLSLMVLCVYHAWLLSVLHRTHPFQCQPCY